MCYIIKAIEDGRLLDILNITTYKLKLRLYIRIQIFILSRHYSCGQEDCLRIF